jgi:hypothetical protein
MHRGYRTMSHHLFQVQRLNGHEQRKWYERNVSSLFVSAATKAPLVLLSINQKNDKWTAEDRKNLLVSMLSRKMRRHQKEKN